MEEEKKRRPRILKQDSPALLSPRDESDGEPENQQERTWQEGDAENRNQYRQENYNNPSDNQGSGWQNNQGSGGWQNRNQGGSGWNQGGNQGGGWQNRNQGGGGNWQNNQGGNQGGGWQNRNQGGGNWQNNQGGNQGGGWQNRNQGGGNWQNNQGGNQGGGWQNRNQGGNQGGGWNQGGNQGGGWQNRNQGGGGNWQNNQGGGWQNRNQGGNQGGGWNQGGNQGGGWQNRNQGGNQGGGWGNQGGNQGGWGNQGGGGWGNQGGNQGGWNRKQKGGNNFGQKKKQYRKQEEFQVQIMPKPDLPSGEDMPLNKYLAHCGIASRRKAVEHITNGEVTVNGEVRTEPFYRVKSDDVIMCEGKLLQVQERMVYVLLNKPKGVITTTDDEKGRATVMDIVDPHYPERVFPVGRLDRDTTGLILLTNDGDLAQKLTHPSYNIQKQYRVGLRKPLAQVDLELIESGLTLDDGPVEVNWVRFSEDHPKHNVVELEITSGRNRIIRRLFEALDYEIFKLDRFYFAGLTKKDLPRGSFRDLTQREIMMLKHFTGHPGTAKKRRRRDADPDAGTDADEFDENAVEVENAEKD